MRIGTVIETAPDGAEIRKGTIRNGDTRYFAWKAGATVAIMCEGLYGAQWALGWIQTRVLNSEKGSKKRAA